MNLIVDHRRAKRLGFNFAMMRLVPSIDEQHHQIKEVKNSRDSFPIESEHVRREIIQLSFFFQNLNSAAYGFSHWHFVTHSFFSFVVLYSRSFFFFFCSILLYSRPFFVFVVLYIGLSFFFFVVLYIDLSCFFFCNTLWPALRVWLYIM